MKTLDNAYALLIGIGADLKASVEDANVIYNVLADKTLCGYKEENIVLLTEEQATKQGILEGLDKMIDMTNDDSSVLIFYSGHGGRTPWNDKVIYWLQPNDHNEENKVYIDSVDFRNKINQMKAKRMVILMDCCHAAGMTNRQDQVSSDSSLQTSVVDENPEGLVDNLGQDHQTVTIMSSCRDDEKSWILPGQVNSLFTQCFIEALKGGNRRFYEDEYVRLTDAVNYIFDQVPKRKPVQNPFMNLKLYDNFALSFIPESRRSQILPPPTPVVEGSSSDAPKSSGEDTSPKEVTFWRETENANNLVLFIHGFSGEATDTFGKIPQLLMEDPQMNGWDLKPIGYSPKVKPELGKDIWAASLDIKKIAMYLESCIKYKFKKYDRIAIVAHSLGGLVAQRALLNLKGEQLNKICHLVLLGTPSNGLDKELIKKEWHNKHAEMSSDGEFITKLRADWNEKFGKRPPFKLRVAAALDDQYVDMDSCFADFDEDVCEMVDGDHLRMVKPKDRDDDCYNLILSTLVEYGFFNQFTDKEEINLAMGKYDAVVKSLLPRKDELDANGLRQLIFALEGMSRSEEAIDILENHPVAKGNTDLMGILGGRFKRSYLKTFKKGDADKAISYYSNALEIATERKDHGQIYYQAINLAFLYLVAYNDNTKCMDYAQIARDSAETEEDNLWKLATLGECYVYFHGFDEAKKYYLKAAALANVRQKLSIYTNAHTGYQAWMAGGFTKSGPLQQETDDFLRFLNQTFLS
ncbi:MAG: caspase family protein [Bacteroidia bacterium]|nr:caspase family protein [Bacteroidia bacterium]NNF81606.1 hypothetical protein [Flavobacteriaceae bacterium]NNL78953.1 hypothetical protein [Flavobacteriaceae bacterium]